MEGKIWLNVGLSFGFKSTRPPVSHAKLFRTKIKRHLRKFLDDKISLDMKRGFFSGIKFVGFLVENIRLAVAIQNT